MPTTRSSSKNKKNTERSQPTPEQKSPSEPDNTTSEEPSSSKNDSTTSEEPTEKSQRPPERNTTPEPDSTTSEEPSEEPENERRAEVSTEGEMLAERPSRWTTERQEKNGFFYATGIVNHRPKFYSAKQFRKDYEGKHGTIREQLEYEVTWYGTDENGEKWPNTWEPIESIDKQEKKFAEMIKYYWAKKFKTMRKYFGYTDKDFEESEKSKSKEKPTDASESSESSESEASSEEKSSEKLIPAPQSKRSRRKK